MLKERLAAAHTVRDVILPLKKYTSLLATEVARGVVTMREARVMAKLKIGTGASAINKVDEAATCLAKAEQLMVEAHEELARLITETGLTRHYQSGEFGDDDATPGFAPPTGFGKLRAVGDAA